MNTDDTDWGELVLTTGSKATLQTTDCTVAIEDTLVSTAPGVVVNAEYSQAGIKTSSSGEREYNIRQSSRLVDDLRPCV